MENEQISITRHWADPDRFSLLLDKARQFAGEYIDGLEQRPVFPAELSLQAMDALDEPLPEKPSLAKKSRGFTAAFPRRASGNGDRHAKGPIADGALEARA
jgi:hypothetical protein